MGIKNKIGQRLADIRNTHSLWEIWTAFIEVTAISIANSVDRSPAKWKKREDRYFDLLKVYGKETFMVFAECLAYLVQALETEPRDILGELFMELNLSDKWKGQFFTPMNIARIMAKMNVPEIKNDGEIITFLDPATGAGALPIAYAEEMRIQGVNITNRIHFTCVDLDIKAVHMAYVQLSLLGIPAVVIHGDSLRMEQWSRWFTPIHIIHGWDGRLKKHRQEQKSADSKILPLPPSLENSFNKKQGQQMALF